MSDVMRVDYTDQPDDVVRAVNVVLAPHGVQFVDDGLPHDGFVLYRLVGPVWTRALPTAAGWYWWRQNGTTDAECLRVCAPTAGYPHLHIVFHDEQNTLPVWEEWMPGEWCGPIPEPR